MKHPTLPKQVLRTIHTSAIFDSQPPRAQTRASIEISRSTARREAVHICGAPARQPRICAVLRTGGRP